MDIPALAGCGSRRQLTDWIDFGGHAPYLWTDEVRGNNSRSYSQLRRAGRRRTPLTIGFALLLLGICATIMIATESQPFIS